MRHVLRAPAALLAATLASGCTNTVEVLKIPVDLISDGDVVLGVATVFALPVLVPVYMFVDMGEILGLTEQDVAAIGQATQDYVTARQQQDAAQAQAAAAAASAQAQQAQQAQQARQAERDRIARNPAPQARDVAYNTPARPAGVDAKHCLSPLPPGESLYGGFRNGCAFKVNVSFCNFRPTAGSSGAAFDCERNQGGLSSVPASGRNTLHTNGAQTVYWAACQDPAYPKVRGSLMSAGAYLCQ